MDRESTTRNTGASRRRTLPSKAVVTVSLGNLQSLESFQEANSHVFPSVPSLRWFFRRNRDDLLKAGAVVELAGRLLINAPVFSELAVTIGSKTASERERGMK